MTTREAADNRDPVGHNAWMEERYRHRVPEILLDVVGTRSPETASRTRASRSDDGTSTVAASRAGEDPSQRASVFTVIQPDKPRALVFLCGVPEGKLPWPLRHWSTSEPYTGNSISTASIPQDWRLDNPRRPLELQITIALCRNLADRDPQLVERLCDARHAPLLRVIAASISSVV